jgi:hypothetical protein
MTGSRNLPFRINAIFPIFPISIISTAVLARET